MTLSWKSDRRRQGAMRADHAGGHLTAESDGFRVELGSLSIDGDAQNLEQAQAFAETALESLAQLDARLTSVDKERLGRGARQPMQAATMRPVAWAYDPECGVCTKGLRQELDGVHFYPVMCGCVKPQ